MFSGCGVGVEPRTPQNLIRIGSRPHEGPDCLWLSLLSSDYGRPPSIAGLVHGRFLHPTGKLSTDGSPTRVCIRSHPMRRVALWPGERNSNPQCDQVSPRPSTKINVRLEIAATAIHAVLRSMGQLTVSSSPRFHRRIMLGRLNRPAFAPKVDGKADAIT